MDLNDSPGEIAFRDAVRAWLAASIPADLREKVSNFGELSKDDLVRWHRILADKGWVAPSWPIEWGGTDWSPVERYIFEEECAYAGAPPIVPFGPTMCASVLLQFGTDAQKQRFLPRIYRCDDFWCQGYSEPGSGSDLASLTTRAERHGEHYVVNGQKTWTTLGHYGDWIFCLVRTDSPAKKQDGISFLLIDMKTPGITVRPLILLDEGHEVNEVFFEDVRVPVENLVHEEGKGWTVAKYLLGHERLNTGRIGASKRELARLQEMAARTTKDGRPLLDDPRFRDRVSRVEIELMALGITNLRFVDEMRRTGRIGAEVSMLKIKGTEIQQAITELLMQVAGPLAQPFRPIDHGGFDAFTASIAPRYFNFRKTSIYAGSNEIQRNIIARAALGL
ncbi:MAG: acyl-CoA dehydrogenase family protein [Burkholderiaceae bacterium]|nr:acyl-CoA dehydrogenase family protein [Burkholderiaceae bacterium]MEB2349994.1 acyl-CoA dehydrogenase family protein [Burkholderiaceae bacterium]